MSNITKLTMASLLLAFFSFSAQATPIGVSIDGELSLAGTISTDDDGSDGSFLDDATTITSFSNVIVAPGTSGDYAADLTVGQSASMPNSLSITLGSTGGIDPFWSVTGTSFTWTYVLNEITSITQTDGVDFLGLEGKGFAYRDGGDVTEGFWSLSANSQGQTLVFSSITSVPEPGMLALLGMGLIGFASIRRKFI